MKPSDLWEEVQEIVERGGSPSIVIPRVSKVIARRGRKRQVKPTGASYWFHWVMKTPCGAGMKCRNHGCARRIRSKVEDIVCSEACRNELRRFCEVTLEVIRGEKRATEYPPDLRGWPRRKGK